MDDSEHNPGSTSTPPETDWVFRLRRKRPVPTQLEQPRTKAPRKEPEDPPKSPKPRDSPQSKSKFNERLSNRRMSRVEYDLAFGSERLQVHYQSYQSMAKSRSQPKPGLDFLPALDSQLTVLLQDAQRYCKSKKYTDAVSSLHTALQLSSEGLLLEDFLGADPEEVNLVLSHIHSRLVEAFFKSKNINKALEHAHRSVHLNPSHFQNHVRQAAVYRALDQPWLAAKSALTADWLYWCGPSPQHRIGSDLRLYWQDLLDKALWQSEVTVMYTSFTADPSPDELLQTAQRLKELDPLVVHVYTDPRGIHILPQTTDWFTTAPGDVQRYYISLGFKNQQEGEFAERLCSRLWPTLAEARALDPEQLKDMYEKILPILDMMQATQLDSGLGPGSGLMERLQYSSLLDELGLQMERTRILLRCQAQLDCAPYLLACHSTNSSSGSPQRDIQMLQELQADLLDELAGEETEAERVWHRVLQVSWLEELLYLEEKRYFSLVKRNQQQMHFKMVNSFFFN